MQFLLFLDKTVMVLSALFFWSTEVLTSLKIISDDMCGRNGLKSKSFDCGGTLDFFTKNTQKLHRKM